MRRLEVVVALALAGASTAMAQQAMFRGKNTVQVVARWDGAYDACEARWPALQGHRDIMLMASFGAAVRPGSDQYHHAVTHLGGLRANALYQPEYQTARANAERVSPDAMNRLCQRMVGSLQSLQSGR